MSPAITADGRGTLNLAGIPLEAELPDNVKAGDELRLVVRELTPDKVVLAIQDDAVSRTASAHRWSSAPRVPMPHGGSLQVTDRDAASASCRQDGTHTLTLRYDAPTFGPIDMTFTLDAGCAAPRPDGARRAALRSRRRRRIGPRSCDLTDAT